MGRKHQYVGGIIGGSPLVSNAPRTSGVFNLGALGGDGGGIPAFPAGSDFKISNGTVTGATYNGSGPTGGSGYSSYWDTSSGSNYFSFTPSNASSPTAFTVIVDFETTNTNAFKVLAAFDISNPSQRATFAADNAGNIIWYDGGSQSFGLPYSANTRYVAVAVYNGSSITGYLVNTAAGTTITSADMTSAKGTSTVSPAYTTSWNSTSTLGRSALGSAEYLSGQIYGGGYWDSALTEAQLADAINNIRGNAIPLTRPTRRWGGITGRSLVSGSNVQGSGVLSLAAHYQAQLGGLVVATGGTYVAHDGYSYNVFYFDTSSTTQQTLTIPTNLTNSVDVLMVAGGGGGGRSIGAGGGAGGMVDRTLSGLAAGSYTITVGGGGAAATSGRGSNGANTTFTGGSLSLPTANGGGGGGTYNLVGAYGGSGGGGVNRQNSQVSAAGLSNQTGTDTYGNDGSEGAGNINTGPYHPGAGGGAGGAAPAAISTVATIGGVGRAISWIPTTLNATLATAIGEESGGSVYFAGGGGGSGTVAASGGAGGLGGGGTGSFASTDAGDGQAHTGGGGGGGDYGFGRYTLAGDGGSGIVVIRYTT